MGIVSRILHATTAAVDIFTAEAGNNEIPAPEAIKAISVSISPGTVITEAGTHPKVGALVYIAAHAPDVGETEAGNGKIYPNSSRPLVKTADDFLLLDPANFPADFAADLPPEQADFMAHAQMPAAAKVFTTPVNNPAWKTKPSWYLVAQADKVINPDLERMYARRAHSHKVEVPGASHAVYISHPKEVAALIEPAAEDVNSSAAR